MAKAKKHNYLGVDLGNSSVKIVELNDEGGRPRLVTYGFTERSTDIIKSDSLESQKEMVRILKEVLKRSRVSTVKTVAALPSFSVFSSIISLPFMSKKDLVSAVRWEAKKFVPMPLEEMILDWEVLKEIVAPPEKKKQVTLQESLQGEKKEEIEEKKEKKEDKETKKATLKVLLTAAPKNLVSRYVQIFKECDLELVGLETEAFALERALVGNDKSPIMLIDIGALSTSIIVFKESVPLLNRSIDVGGVTITNTIANALNIDPGRADQFKRDYGLSLSNEGRIPEAIKFVINSIVNEVKYVINIYQHQNNEPIEKIIFAGGSSFLTNLPDYFSNIFRLKAYIGDPWSRVIYPLELKPILEEIGPRFAVSIGLAMREII